MIPNSHALRLSTAALFLLLSACLSARGQAETAAQKNTDEPTLGVITGKVVNENGQRWLEQLCSSDPRIL